MTTAMYNKLHGLWTEARNSAITELTTGLLAPKDFPTGLLQPITDQFNPIFAFIAFDDFKSTSVHESVSPGLTEWIGL